MTTELRTLGHGGAPVERIDTHASVVFLAGDRAWKLKRTVRYEYLDYATAERRRAMCEAEVRINRRTAPALYRGVSAVTREPDGNLAIGGCGTPVDWLVEMVRFDQGCLFDRLAEAGLLPLQLMGPLAHAIARFHHAAVAQPNQGGWEAMRRVIDGNAAGFRCEAVGILAPIRCAALTNHARAVLDWANVLLDQRRDDGLVRHCHGNLHLRNILLLGDQPTLFDAIEFNDDISSIDVLYDLAFLLMDLWRLDLPHHANVVWNSYLAETGDLDGLPLMPPFLSCRAAVMAKTTATAARLEADAVRRRDTDAVSRQVYAAVMQQAEQVLRSGHAAIADAVFADASDRDAIEHVARAAGVPFAGLWLDAPVPVLLSRVERRVADASDAGIEVIWQQLALPQDAMRWHRVDASGTRQQISDLAATIVDGRNEVPPAAPAPTAEDRMKGEVRS